MTKEEALLQMLIEAAYGFDPICDCGEPGYACVCCWGCGAHKPIYCLCEEGPTQG